MHKIRLLIAEDTTLMRRLLAYQLSEESDIEIVGEATNGREAVTLACHLRPDVALLDLDMPLLNGLQATERIVAQLPCVQVVLITGYEHLASLSHFSEAAACLKKDCTPQELVSAIRHAWHARATSGGEPNRIRNSQQVIERLAKRVGLSASEQRVLERVVGTDLTIQQISGSLSEETRSPVTASSVKHALTRAMTKLRITPRTRSALVKYVLESGESVAEAPSARR